MVKLSVSQTVVIEVEVESVATAFAGEVDEKQAFMLSRCFAILDNVVHKNGGDLDQQLYGIAKYLNSLDVEPLRKIVAFKDADEKEK